MREKIAIIGSGFSSLSASCYLSKAGFDVTIFEKNNSFGGRARQFKKDGFTFDIGPSWYWMPDIFENFFNDFNEKRENFYDLEKLDPAYEVYFGPNDSIKIGDTLEIVVLDIPLYLENKMYKRDDIIIFLKTKKKDVDLRLKKRKKEVL